MNRDLGLKILSEVMRWDDNRSRDEFRWLQLMARLKYDGYRDFQAGMRFVESLVTWLQQFEQGERETAYAFVRNTLVYVGPAELQHLVEQFYPKTVRHRIFATVAATHGIPTHRVLADPVASDAAKRLRRSTLFMGLSDGARIDVLRHSNVGILSNEQLVIATQVDKEKWADLLTKLRSDLGDPKATFRLVYLLDDFAGTGTSFLRYDNKKAKWSGKLFRFSESIAGALADLKNEALFDTDWELCVHHYLASSDAAAALVSRHEKAKQVLEGKHWARDVHFSFGNVLPSDLPLGKVPGRDDAFVALTQKYYNSEIETEHTAVGGVDHIGLGYGGCALPLILEHNTPNNSIALLWAEVEGSGASDGSARPMRPLFRRRQRHG